MINDAKEVLAGCSFDWLVESGRMKRCDVDVLRLVASTAERTSTETYLVGGMVRELVAGFVPVQTPPDVTVVGYALRFADELVSDAVDSKIVWTTNFGTAKVRIADTVVGRRYSAYRILRPTGRAADG